MKQSGVTKPSIRALTKKKEREKASPVEGRKAKVGAGQRWKARSVGEKQILKALNSIAYELMAKPGSIMPTKIRGNTQFYPYFKVYM
ncbi:hypothetical protein RND71_012968 [Anisodus tanguticus]|uniref:Uncharacterized protein n=1 Tax=Anisodus tanguticus TaxID=243964 RepID=A0AAE1VM94_9SOLA|nr:hypothetical protein RND71_012968 [Anisodus tanguticus]